MSETAHAILKQALKDMGADGLAGDGCGCLLNDLAPCGEIKATCEAGKRRDIPKVEECGCEGEGTAHWHVEPMEGNTRATPEAAILDKLWEWLPVVDEIDPLTVFEKLRELGYRPKGET